MLPIIDSYQFTEHKAIITTFRYGPSTCHTTHSRGYPYPWAWFWYFLHLVGQFCMKQRPKHLTSTTKVFNFQSSLVVNTSTSTPDLLYLTMLISGMLSFSTDTVTILVHNGWCLRLCCDSGCLNALWILSSSIFSQKRWLSPALVHISHSTHHHLNQWPTVDIKNSGFRGHGAWFGSNWCLICD